MINTETLRHGLRGAFLLERFMWLGYAPDVTACLQSLRAVLPAEPLADAHQRLRIRKRKSAAEEEAPKLAPPAESEASGAEGAPDNKTLLRLIARAQRVQMAVLWSPLLTAFDLAEKNLALLPNAGPFANHSVSSAELSTGGRSSSRWFMTDPANGGLFGRMLVRTLALPEQSTLQSLSDWLASSWRTTQSRGGLLHVEGVVGPADVRILGLTSGAAEITVRAGTPNGAISVFNEVVDRISETLPGLPAGGFVDVVSKYLVAL